MNMPGDNSREYDEAPERLTINAQVREAADGKLHDAQYMNEVGGFADLATTEPKVVAQVPVGRKFHLRTVVITNKETDTVSYTVGDGTSAIELIVAAGQTLVLTGLRGLILSGNVTVKASDAVNGSKVAVGGELRALI